MAEGRGKKPSDEDLKLLELIKTAMKDQPHTDTMEGKQEWVTQLLSGNGSGIKEEHDVPERPKMQINKREPPKISCFSGANLKNETTYDLWKYEVTSLMNDALYDYDSINYAVRRSLKGEAGRVAMHLGPQASLQDILRKLESIYGAVESKEEILAHFYRAKQNEDESVTTWSCRLEDLLGKAVNKGLVHHTEKDEMLRSMLWTGLRPTLKDISGHKFDTIGTFDELRIALRHIERDHTELEKPNKKPQIAKSATPDQVEPKPDKMDELTGLVFQLASRMDSYEKNQQVGNGDKGRNSKQNNYYNRQNYQRGSRNNQNVAHSNNNPTREIKCYRCGQLGHIKKGCRVRLNDLNSNKPPGQDHL